MFLDHFALHILQSMCSLSEILFLNWEQTGDALLSIVHSFPQRNGGGSPHAVLSEGYHGRLRAKAEVSGSNITVTTGIEVF